MHYYICAMVSCAGNKVHHLERQSTPPTLFLKHRVGVVSPPLLAVHSSKITSDNLALLLTLPCLTTNRVDDLKVRVFSDVSIEGTPASGLGSLAVLAHSFRRVEA